MLHPYTGIEFGKEVDEVRKENAALRADLTAALAQLAEYKRLLDEEAAASLALTAELNDIAAAAGIFRHPDEKDQLANAVAALRSLADRAEGK